MLALRRRLGGPILLSICSLTTIFLLLHNAGLSTHLAKIPQFGKTIWKWGFQSENEFVDGVRLVVLGDSWADNHAEKGQEGRGRSWTDVLCMELNCTSSINLAESQFSKSYLLDLPTGAVTSNKIHEKAIFKSQFVLAETTNFTLPDLARQVQSFISLPLPIDERREIVFILSIGFWDIYHFAGLEYNSIDASMDCSIDEVFSQLDILYSHFQSKLINSMFSSANATNPPPTFRLVMPKLIDPSLLPGWQTQRPEPISPSNVAEQQKHAINLTRRWNSALERRLSTWINTYPALNREAAHNEGHTLKYAEKELFYFDLPSYILDLIIERSLEAEGLTDETGLGKQESPLVDVYLPCISEEEIGRQTVNEFVEVDGKMVCKSPRTYLWWDGWTLGSLASEGVGKKIGEMVREGNSWGPAARKAEV